MAKLTIDVPRGMDVELAKRVATQAVDTVAAMGAVEDALAQAPVSPGPGHVAQAALRDERWRTIEVKWGLYTAAEVAKLVGGRPEAARALTGNLRRRKGLTGVKRLGALRYPGFQFVANHDGSLGVAPAWSQLKQMLAPAQWSDADLLAWSAAPNAWLDGRSPAEEIQAHPTVVSDVLAKAVREAVPDLRVSGVA